jgi:hypothetical protein
MSTPTTTTRTVDRDTDRLVRMYFQNGWAPIPYAHHPPHIRQAIRAARMRPKMKGCFENCIRLMLQQHEVPLTYCEGWVTTANVPFPIDHAWLKDADGKMVDVTLNPAATPILFQEFTVAQVREGILRSRVYGHIDPHWMAQARYEAWNLLGKRSHDDNG